MFGIGLLGGLLGLGEAAIQAWAGVTIAEYAFYGLVVTSAVQLFGMIKDYLTPIFRAIGNIIEKLADIIVQFIGEVFKKILEWFKSKSLRQGVDVPFISTDKNIGQYIGSEFKIQGYDKQFENGEMFFTGVYDQKTGKVRAGQIVENPATDAETNRAIEAAKNGNGYVVLTA